MSVVTFRGGAGELEPLVAASRAEGWTFVAKLAAELMRGDFERPGTALFGVYRGALGGVCALARDPYLVNCAGVGRLRHLYVLPQHRGQGVATALVSAVIGEARRHYHVLRLRTDNPNAARLYETLGFAAADEHAATHRLALR